MITALAATTVGLVFGATFVVVYYLAAPVRLRLATYEKSHERVLEGELARLGRLGDAAAVSKEHDLSGAAELRAEIDLRALLLMLASRRARAGGHSRKMR